jgi:hypothetical protein
MEKDDKLTDSVNDLSVPTDTPEMSLSVSNPLSGDEEWNVIVNRIVDELANEDIPDKVITAAEMLINGFPIYKTAKKLGVRSDTVRRWLSRYPALAVAVANGRQLLTRWRMARLEQQFLTAVERSQEILEVPLDGELEDGTKVNPKILPVVAAQARYIIGLFAGQKVDINITHELGDTVMKANQDALTYIAEQLAAQQMRSEGEPIEAVYRIIDAEVDNAGPMLDENGSPPFGELGRLDTTPAGTLCHICGRRFRGLGRHLFTNHATSPDEYESLYMLEEGSVRRNDNDRPDDED